MLELGSCSVNSASLTGDRHALGRQRPPSGPQSECPVGGLDVGTTPKKKHHILRSSTPTDPEKWQKRGSGETPALLEPRSLSICFDTLYLPQMPGHEPPNRLGLTLDVGSTFDVGGGIDGDPAVSPNVMKRRRGGLIEQRDIVKAHQAHKIHSTPQARRKEWE
ncbi:hypothetical protein NQZ68_032861 [Dissostichus eleginoides]|uniref:Ankyrin repeat domain containing protein 34C n=1 Tax=Dissostichus eleginoides TaxID=100907 RepID=A0AAD9C5Y0_DISEL|nr:hypothetical protein NQZ68_032861 [Dissostichus eleginoides]KAK1896472.1 Ankyrin repeat domain containing protein 34C [Dissostichus eleginoides]